MCGFITNNQRKWSKKKYVNFREECQNVANNEQKNIWILFYSTFFSSILQMDKTSKEIINTVKQHSDWGLTCWSAALQHKQPAPIFTA